MGIKRLPDSLPFIFFSTNRKEVYQFQHHISIRTQRMDMRMRVHARVCVSMCGYSTKKIILSLKS